MNSPSWLNTVPVCTDVYIFQAALLCEDCGRATIAELEKEGVIDDEDSDSFPQGPYGDGGGEADSAYFCDRGRSCVNAIEIDGHKIGCPLGNPLTSYGIEALRKSVREDLCNSKKFSRLMGRLLCRVWQDYCSPDETFSRMPPQYGGQLAEKLPKSLTKSLKEYVSRVPNSAVDVHIEVYCDVEAVYFLASRGPKQRYGYKWGEAVDLLKAPVNDEGEFGPIQVASVQPEVAENQTIGDLLREAIRWRF